MKNFMIIYHVSESAMKEMANSTPEEQEEGMKGWMVWAEKCGDKLVDMGTPLMGGQALSPDGTSKDSNKMVTGFSVLQAADMKEAKRLLNGHPHLTWNAECTIEVHESMPLPGM